MRMTLPIISAHDITLSHGGNRVLDGVSLDLFPEETVVVVGNVSTGKTSLLNVLCGVCTPDGGDVVYRNEIGECRSLTGISRRQLRYLHLSEWGYVNQDPGEGLRMGMTAGGNIVGRMVAAGENRYVILRKSAIEWMLKVGLDPARIDDLPGSFSEDMQRRLQMASALISRPRLLVVDGPAGGLEESSRGRIMDLLERLAEESRAAVVIATRDPASAPRWADRIAVIREGRLLEAGVADRGPGGPPHPPARSPIVPVHPAKVLRQNADIRGDGRNAAEPFPGKCPKGARGMAEGREESGRVVC